MKTSVLLALCVLLSLPATAAVYECGDGRYSNKPGPGCRSADLPKIGSYSSERPRPVRQPQAETAAAPAPQRAAAPVRTPAASQRAAYQAPAAPVVAPPTTRTNSGRRMILEQELANERRALADAQKALTESRTLPRGNGAAYAAHQARINSLQSDVLDRQQNIQALQRELSRM
ncbi:hypothetical protein [Neisseria shayeganii]|uniref:DUF4124 domain-containing protein n=1 Tax=Neisseria shayeganii 871 TaxID=1032488 RepID=G4CIZ8_9NEIS|nr:hypothetical protein [Neisseria shayeganii]EGY52092.1 hypothetical protein HMPREF9371_1587 [Neisseria shayeganii 871]